MNDALSRIKPTPTKIAGALGALWIVASFLLQLTLGSDILVAGMATGASVVVFLLVLRRPDSLATWYAAYMYLQLFGIAWIVKSLLFLKFESGLLLPVESIGWGSLFVLTACGSSFILDRGHGRTPLINIAFGDPNAWERTGVNLFFVGEIAHYISFAINQGETLETTIGTFETVKSLSMAGTCLFSAAAARKGKFLSKWVIIALASGTLNALFFSQKAELLLRVLSCAGIYSFAEVSWKKKLRLAIAGPILLLFMNSFVFPVVHATREIRDKNLGMNERITVLKSSLTKKVDKSQYDKDAFGNIWNENVHFLPTSNWLFMRFGSIAYFDVTAQFGAPGSSKMTAGDFFDRSISQALPRGFYGEKDPYTLADRLWYDLDTRIEPGGFLTMGTYAGARLIFGNWTGYLVTSALLFIVLALYLRIYGTDMRSPMVMFVFINQFYVLNDADLDSVTQILIRFLWQDLVLFLGVKYGADFVRNMAARFFRRGAS